MTHLPSFDKAAKGSSTRGRVCGADIEGAGSVQHAGCGPLEAAPVVVRLLREVCEGWVLMEQAQVAACVCGGDAREGCKLADEDDLETEYSRM